MKQLVKPLSNSILLNASPQPCASGINPSGPLPVCRGSIDPAVAQKRIEVFRIQKNQKRLIEPIKYNPCGFLDLLTKLTNVSKNYSGLRIYLAADTVNIKDLMLVFVPTYYTVINGMGINKDDTDSIYSIVNNNASKLSVEEASKYIKSFQTNHLQDFNENGRTILPEFNETTNIWYDISLFKPGYDPHTRTTGMITVLQYLIDKGNIDLVVVDFAAFDHTAPVDYFYQIMLVFNFYEYDGLKISFAGSNSVLTYYEMLLENPISDFIGFTKEQLVAFKQLMGSFGYTDTGVPCPPPPSGQTCGTMGGSLP